MVDVPLPVLLLTIVTPFTLLTALSKGLVIVIIILSTGICPASTNMVMRGNNTSGNKLVCILLYENAPAIKIKMPIKIIGLEKI